MPTSPSAGKPINQPGQTLSKLQKHSSAQLNISTPLTLLKRARAFAHPTPFMVIDPNEAHHNMEVLQQLLPGVGLYYAIKSNDDPKLIQALDDIAVGYDIASLGEFEHLQALGISAKRMLFSNPVKIPFHIQKTYEQGIRLYAFDSNAEIAKLARNAPGSEVYLRLKVPDKGSTFPLSHKYGVHPTEALGYLERAKQAGLQPVGLAFHVGSQCDTPISWTTAFHMCKEVMQQAAAHGLSIKLINIGGGIPASYTQSHLPLQQIAKTIAEGIASLPPGTHIVAELGRSVVASTGIIVTTIIGREQREQQEWLFLDMGVFQGLIEPLEVVSWRYPLFTDYDDSSLNSQRYVLSGPSCDVYDSLGEYQLPSELSVQDRIYIASTGAYTTTYKSNFNGFGPPKVYYSEQQT